MHPSAIAELSTLVTNFGDQCPTLPVPDAWQLYGHDPERGHVLAYTGREARVYGLLACGRFLNVWLLPSAAHSVLTYLMLNDFDVTAWPPGRRSRQVTNHAGFKRRAEIVNA